MNKLYLFKPASIIGRIITLVTGTKYSHSAVEFKGVMYDTSESRATFGQSDIDLSKRKYVVYDFHGDLTLWKIEMSGKKYDWKGVFGWIFGAEDKHKFYCFESSWAALHRTHHAYGNIPKKLTGEDLEKVMLDFGYVGTRNY